MKPMSKKIIYIVLTFFLSGLVLSVIGLGLGGHMGLRISNTGIHTASEESKSYELPKTKLADFSKVDLELDYGSIEILPSEDGNAYLEYLLFEESGVPSYDVHNGILSVSQRDNSWGFTLWGLHTMKKTASPYLRLYLPKDKALTALQVYSESGTITVDQIKAGTVDMDIDYGNLEIKNSVFSSMEFTSDSTEMMVSDSEIKDLKLDGEYGDLTLNNFASDYTTITLESCDVYLDAAKLGNLDYDNEYGELTLCLPESMEKYSFDISLEYGDIRLPSDAPAGFYNNEDSSESYRTKGTGANMIKIVSESGNVEIQERQ